MLKRVTKSLLRWSSDQHHFPNTSQGGRCTFSNTFSSKHSYHFSPPINLNHSATLRRIFHKSHISKKRNIHPIFLLEASEWHISECVSTCQRKHGTSWWHTAPGLLDSKRFLLSNWESPKHSLLMQTPVVPHVWFHAFLQIAYENVQWWVFNHLNMTWFILHHSHYLIKIRYAT